MFHAKKSAVLFIGLLACVILAVWGYNAAADDPTPQPTVVRVYYQDVADIQALMSYDLWEYNNVTERYVLVALDASQIPAIEALGFMVAVDEAETAVLRNPANRRPFNNGYRTVDELYADLDAAAATHPDLTQLVDYGQSYCLAQNGCTTPGGDQLAGYPLRALRITNEAIAGASMIAEGDIEQGTKPIFFLHANIHAREITTPELAMRLADWLLDNYGTDADATWLVDWHEIWIVPVANPDGHWLVELGTQLPYNGSPFYQRKNLNNDTNNNGFPDCSAWPPTIGTQLGVDLNRNHSFAWGPPGSSSSPCSEQYRGPGAASESEVRQLESLVRQLIPDQRGSGLTDPAPSDTTGIFLTLHSYSRLVLWPWGYTTAPAPNKAGLEAIGDKLASFNNYTSCQPSICLYGTNGATDDWVYGELGVPSFTFEVGSSFMPPYAQIDLQQWPENKPAFVYAAKIAAAPYQLVQGPEVTRIETAVSTATTLTLTATLDDRQNGNRPIAAAAYSVGTPIWDNTATTMPLQPADGLFDGSLEEGTAVIDTSTLSVGQHLLFLHAQDSDGHWGAVTATYITVEEPPPAEPTIYLPIISKGSVQK